MTPEVFDQVGDWIAVILGVALMVLILSLIARFIYYQWRH